MPIQSRKRLPLIALALLLVYHAVAALNSHNYKCPFTWKEDALEIRRGEKRFALVNTPVTHQGLAPLFPDWSSVAISRPGFILRYLLRDLREDVYVGRPQPHRRIYLREEIRAQYPWSDSLFEETYANQLRGLIRSAEGHRLEFLVLPIPPKMSVERDEFGEVLPPSNTWEKHPPGVEDFAANYRRILDLDRDRFVDIFGTYRDYRSKHGAADIYMPTDSHWSSLGVGLAAQSVLRHLKNHRYPDIAIPELKIVGHDEQPTEGDIVRLLSIPKMFSRRFPEFGWHETYYDFDLPAAPANARRVVLIGTSYSHYLADTTRGLAALIGKALGRVPVTASSALGGRLIGSLKDLNERGFKLRSDDLVLFEFATRQPWQADESLPALPPLENSPPRSITSETF